MKNRRLSFRLEDEEAVVIAPMEFWEQVITLFKESAQEFPETAEGWNDAAEHVAEWVERTRDKRQERT